MKKYLAIITLLALLLTLVIPASLFACSVKDCKIASHNHPWNKVDTVVKNADNCGGTVCHCKECKAGKACSCKLANGKKCNGNCGGDGGCTCGPCKCDCKNCNDGKESTSCTCKAAGSKVTRCNGNCGGSGGCLCDDGTTEITGTGGDNGCTCGDNCTCGTGGTGGDNGCTCGSNCKCNADDDAPAGVSPVGF
ncbi:MAG: hypothetical protein LBB49_02940 [Gracilibacteraceae bacterium]|nr:hypothetical protein [Gracilibacteraceae bacterium]